MLEIICLVAGGAIGFICANFILDRKTAYGIFSVEPGNDPEEPGIVNLRIKIFNNQNLYDKKKILLVKDTHK